MWTRSEIKRKAKEACKRNHWKTVLIGLIAAMLLSVGSFSLSVSSGAGARTAVTNVTSETTESGNIITTITTLTSPEGNPLTNVQSLTPFEILKGLGLDLEAHGITEEQAALYILIALVVVILFAITCAILFDVFVINPLEVGTCRFFTENLNYAADAAELLYPVDNGFRRVCGTMFKRDLKLILWTLLLIVPGIIKSFEYRMVPYLLAEHPELSSKEVFVESKRLMKGNKWRSFVLDLSFLGWDILNIFTLGLLGIFKINGYRYQTYAALYEALCNEDVSFSSGSYQGGGSHFAGEIAE